MGSWETETKGPGRARTQGLPQGRRSDNATYQSPHCLRFALFLRFRRTLGMSHPAALQCRVAPAWAELTGQGESPAPSWPAVQLISAAQPGGPGTSSDPIRRLTWGRRMARLGNGEAPPVSTCRGLRSEWTCCVQKDARGSP